MNWCNTSSKCISPKQRPVSKKSLTRTCSKAGGVRYVIRPKSLMTLCTHEPVGLKKWPYKNLLVSGMIRTFLGGMIHDISQQENLDKPSLPKPFLKPNVFRQAASGVPISGGSRVPSSIQLLSAAEMLYMFQIDIKSEIYIIPWFSLGNQVLLKKSLEVIVENLLVVLRFNMLHQIRKWFRILPTEFQPRNSHWRNSNPKKSHRLRRFGPTSIVTKTAWRDNPLYKRPQAHGLNAVQTRQHRKASRLFGTFYGLRSLNENSEM